MIDYEKYAEFRTAKGMKDSDVSKKANIPQSTFSDWKKGKSRPKAEKMQKIAEVLEMDYAEFIGPVGKFSSYRPEKVQQSPEANSEITDEIIAFYRQYQALPPDLKNSVDSIIKSQRPKT